MSEKIREQSPARRQLESSIRALLPSDEQISAMVPGKSTAVSTAGLGGVLTGYIWGRFRGRQVRKRKES